MEDYKQRFVKEYKELKERRDKLSIFFNKLMAREKYGAKIDISENVSSDILKVQLNHMDCYLDALEIRAAIEGIELNDI